MLGIVWPYLTGESSTLYDVQSMPFDQSTLSIAQHSSSNAPNKVIACFAETGQTEKIVLCSKKVGYLPDYVALLQHIMRTNPEKGAKYATQLVNGPLVDVERVSGRPPVDAVFALNIL